ncbi:toxin-antitoxin system YwqK family antitoxin [Spirosoma aerolatum]|uniref:toxin-antitoxin system YwqK family antitoxin n=1 Tax=Spirosoma aerolatum TaxID=1211326 RepID=UPI0014744D4D|nr:toxin-antitoxin system YwqK family antitoxin [Spirosoma aerolatum]
MCIALLWLASCSGHVASDKLPAFEATTVHVHWQNGLAVENNHPFTGMVYTLAENKKDTVEIVGFRDGKEQGEWKRFYENGKLAEKRFFNKGQKVGDLTAWWPDGSLRMAYHFANGEYNGVCREWGSTGLLLKEMTYKDGYEEGSQKQFYDNGKIKANYVMIAGKRYGLLGTKNCVNATDSLFKL